MVTTLILADINSSHKIHTANLPTLFLYILLLFSHIALVWILPYFPTQDGPSHLYNLAILHDLINGGKEWGEYFTYNLRATPNLGFNLISYPFLSIVTPITAEKIFLSIYIILLGTAVPLLISTFAAPSPFSRTIKFIAIPIIFNFTLMMGFYSYVIAVTVFLLAISLAWWIREWSGLRKFVCYNAAGIFLFYLHLIPFVFYLIALVIFAIVEHESVKKAAISLTKQTAGILPLVITLIFYLSNEQASPVPSDFSYLLSSSRAESLLTNLFTFSTAYFSPWQLPPILTILLAIFLLLRAGLKNHVKVKAIIPPGQKAMIFLAAALTLIYIVVPPAFGGGSFFNQRLPWVILLLLLPFLAGVCVKAGARVDVLIVVAAVMSLCINTVVFKQQSEEVAIFLKGLNSGCSKGDLIMLYRPERQKIDVILHAPSYYGIANGCVDVGNYETAFNYFPVHFKKSLEQRPTFHKIYNDPSSIDFSQHSKLVEVIGWELQADDQKKLQSFYDRSFANDKLTLWRRR